MTNKSAKPQIIALLIVYLIASLIEPCDGHGCDRQQVTHGR
jgi:hypothetical protein